MKQLNMHMLKVKRKPIYIALIMSYSSLVAQAWQILTRDHTALPAIYSFINELNEPCI